MRTRERHGMRHTPEYKAWADMLQRCYNPRRRQWRDWGGRGITVCEVWRNSFTAFYRDMGPCPKGFTLDRKENDGHYEPGNCRWADRQVQAINKRLMYRNKSGVNGVWWYAERGHYVVKMNVDGRVRHFGSFVDFFEACCARKSAENTFRNHLPLKG